MPTYTGTHDIRLLLQTRFAGVKDITEMTIREVLELDMALHSQLASEMFAELVKKYHLCTGHYGWFCLHPW